MNRHQHNASYALIAMIAKVGQLLHIAKQVVSVHLRRSSLLLLSVKRVDRLWILLYALPTLSQPRLNRSRIPRQLDQVKGMVFHIAKPDTEIDGQLS
jgi:hypothetical protein